MKQISSYLLNHSFLAIPSIRPEEFTDDMVEAGHKNSFNPEDSVILLRIQALHEEMIQLQKTLQAKGEDMNNLMALYQRSRVIQARLMRFAYFVHNKILF